MKQLLAVPLVVIGLLLVDCVQGPVVLDDYGEHTAECLTLDSHNFDSLVVVPGLVAMVDFYSPYCLACRKMDPAVDSLTVRFGTRALVGKVRADEEEVLSERFDIDWWPTFVFLKGGVEYGRVVGSVTADSLATVMKQGLTGGI